MDIDLDQRYNQVIDEIKALMIAKNHDYGEAWRDMRISSITDQILVKAFRIMEIERKHGKTLASEGTASELRDIVNYCIFALIKISEQAARISGGQAEGATVDPAISTPGS